jgi:hypothetical protein
MTDASYCPDFCEMFSWKDEIPDIIAYKSERGKIQRLLENNIILKLHGKPGTGKRFILKKAAKILKKNLLFADFEALGENNVMQIAAQCIITDSVLCIHGFEPTDENQIKLYRISKALKTYLSAIVITLVDDKIFRMPDGCISHTIKLGDTSVAEQKQLWEYFIKTGSYQLSDNGQ